MFGVRVVQSGTAAPGRAEPETLREPAVVSVECLTPGKNTAFAVGYADQETVLKIGTAAPDSVRAESAVVQFVAGRTSIPVPAVLAAGEAPLPAPFALFERVAGRTVDDLSPALSSATLRGVGATAGRHLATLHATETFDDAGPLVAGPDGLQPADVASDWPSVFEQTLRAKVDDLPPAFDAHADTVDAAVAWAATNPGRYGDCVPTHLDYRPANLVLRSGDGVDGGAADGASDDSGTDDGADPVVAVLDWGGAAAAPAAYEIAHTEALLTTWPDTDESVRECLRTGYRAVAERVPSVPNAARVDAVLRLAKHLEPVVACRGADRETVVDGLVGRLCELADVE